MTRAYSAAGLRHSALATLLLFPNLFIVQTASAVVIRHDRPAEKYIALATRYKMVGHLMDQAGCTLIAPRWAITAAHTIEGINPFSDVYVTFQGKRYEIEKIIIHPSRVNNAVDASADMALLKLSTPVAGITPALLYEKGDEIGKVITLLGWGATGDGLRGSVIPPGETLRAATNEIEATLENSMITSFDAPPDCTDLEGAAGAGDSGGPALWEQDGKVFILGVGAAGTGKPNSTKGKYGTFDTYARVSTRRSWIQEIIGSDPPSTLTMWDPLVKLGDNIFWPPSPAGQVASAFFAAYKSGRLDAMEKFYSEWAQANPTRSFRERAEGWKDSMNHASALVIYGYRLSGPNAIAVVTTTPERKEWQGYLFELSQDTVPKLTGITTGGISPPRQ